MFVHVYTPSEWVDDVHTLLYEDSHVHVQIVLSYSISSLELQLVACIWGREPL